MILMRILPSVLKELSKHVPTVLFQTVEWSELASELPKITHRMLHKEDFAEFFDRQHNFLSPYNIVLTKDPLSGGLFDGKKLLKLFFTQLYSPHGLFLDLRSHHFENSETVLKWHPSAFWTQFDESFRIGLLDVYEGFYLNQDDLYFEGLEKIGILKPNWSDEDKMHLGNLFRMQFGNNEMSFDLEQFKDSIINMSDFMIKKKVKISKDFLYLGIYLVTLYSSLEETKSVFPVKEIYLEVKDRFNAAKIR